MYDCLLQIQQKIVFSDVYALRNDIFSLNECDSLELKISKMFLEKFRVEHEIFEHEILNTKFFKSPTRKISC